MSFWFGRVMGATFGLFTGGPFGALVGFVTGSLFDDAFAKKIQGDIGSIRGQAQLVFYRATYRALGRLAKADGRVCEQEIQAASMVMDRMGLQGSQRQTAIDYFNQGKEADYHPAQDLLELQALARSNQNLLWIFLEVQLGLAYADGNFNPAEQQVLAEYCQYLGVSRSQFEHLHARVLGNEPAQDQGELAKAYRVLGVSANVSDTELKKAYRKLMSQHHPDKLMATGASEKQLQTAKEQTQRIQTAYDMVSKQRRPR